MAHIENIEYLGVEDVYDIADVKPNNNYIANGMITHNTVDEANFLEVVEDSRRAGVVDVYDAAEEMYNAVWTRMTSRFMRAGKVPGMITMISSPRYPDDFLEKKVKEAKELGDKSRIFWKRLKIWDVKPSIWRGGQIWSGKKFRFDVDELRVLEPDEEIPMNESGETHEIIEPPIELEEEFEKSPERALRDLDARPLLALSPYFRKKSKVHETFAKKVYNPFNDDTLLFDENFQCNDNFSRYIHIDLAVKKDAVGIAMCHIPKFIKVKKVNIIDGETVTEIANMPYVKVDFVGRIKSIQGEEIIFSDIQEIIYQITERGFFLNLISFDHFQSIFIQQNLREDGYTVAELSMDRTANKIIVDHDQRTERGKRDGYRKESTGRQYTAPYATLKDAFYEDRIEVPYHEHLQRELLQLESIKKGGIELVSKPSKGSDDCAQALAGSVFNACNNEIYVVATEPKAEKSSDLYDDFYDRIDQDLVRKDDYSDGDSFYDRYGESD